MDDDRVFRALADVSRRTILDALRKEDGQTLGQLAEPLPMTRYGVMKHLTVLEEAGLVTVERVGREKHHYLNAVPLQTVYERWVSRFSAHWAGSLTSLKRFVEEGVVSKHVQMVFIRARAEKIWEALTRGEITPAYYFGTAVEGEWRVGGEYRYSGSDGQLFIDGRVLEVDPPHHLVTTFNPHWGEYEGQPESRVTWSIEPEGDVCRVTLTHEGIDPESEFGSGFVEGWARILSGLKTLLETGGVLVDAAVATGEAS